VPASLPLPSTLLHLLQEHFDLVGHPRRYFFELLSFFATAEHEKEKLHELASTEGQEDLRNYSHKPRRTPLEVLKDFPSVKVPLEYIFELLPRIQARSFSISSSLLAHPNQIQVTVAVVSYKTMLKVPRKGLCSTWLASLNPTQGVRIPIWVKKGTVNLPPDATKPIIGVGPGTGCAIFRAFFEERKIQKNSGAEIGQSAYFFGCRHESKDFLHRDQWLSYLADGTLQLLETAFSQDQANKVYVQHLIKKHSKKIWQWIFEGAYIYVSGSAKLMPKSVREAFKEVLQSEGKISDEEAEIYLQEMEKKKRYQTDTWY